MARNSGTKNLAPIGNNVISSPRGDVLILSSATGKVYIGQPPYVDPGYNVPSNLDVTSLANVGNPYGTPYDPSNIYDTVENRQAGAAYFAGGVGIEKDLNVGGYIYGRITYASTSLEIQVTATNLDQTFYPIFANRLNSDGLLYGDNQSSYPDGGLTYNPAQGLLSADAFWAASTKESTSTVTGAFTASGGVGIAGNINVGGAIYPGNNFTDSYLNTVYSKFLTGDKATNTLVLGAGTTDLFGDIRVRGNNPIGTAPVVTNVLYVTVDGDDTNDGRAMDPSRACRTIAGATKSPYYQSGTQINVSAGHYLEDNPIELKPYTSVKGSDIRTTFIEPINKTQDLFHVQSGCYLNYMTFLNGRSGLLEGQYANGYNRGAYATAFPPQTGDNRIDLFHSPYVQNCTNQSGPWLKDGTMFVPDQTVQIPVAVGTGTWEANTTTIVVAISSGTITNGMSINPGPQNPGFINARTLILANKPFIQSQAVAFIEKTFNSGSFTYDQAKCSRDTGLIIRAIANDMLYDSTSDSTFAGIQYWNQDSYTGQIPSEITATIASIVYLKGISQSYVNAGNRTALGNLFDTIIDILTNGTDAVTDRIIYGGLPSDNTVLNNDFQSLQVSRSTMQADVIAWISANYPTLQYTTATCYRDVGYIIDSVSFDLLHGGNVQSIKSGVYYYGYSNVSVLDASNQTPATTAAYNFINSIVGNIVTAKQIANPYQTSNVQVVSLPAGTIHETATLQNNINVITTIIRNGASSVSAFTPINLTENTSTGVLNAYSLLIANIPFIQSEVLAFLNATMNNFTYNRQLSFRDSGILIENMAYDMAFGGNQKSVESGNAFWNNGVSVIPTSQTQCVSAIDYIRKLCQQVIVNQTCTTLVVPSGISVYSQVFNSNLVGGSVASQSIQNLFNIVTSIIIAGPGVAPLSYYDIGPDQAFVSAEILIQANRSFIQENVINYINYNLCRPPKTLPYNQIKCRRDTGVIIDSIATELLFSESGYSQSTFAGLQYFNQSGYVGKIKSQLNPTIDAITYLRDLSVKVVTGVTTATDALVGVYRYTNEAQVTATNYATSAEVSTIGSEFNNILTILNGKITGWTDQLVTDNGVASNLSAVHNTVDLLLANTNYLTGEVLAYINYNNPGFVYSTSTCARDVGYIIQSVSFDLLYGGNRQGIQAGLSYYVNNFENSVIPGESVATVDAFNYLNGVLENLILGNTYVSLQNSVKPILGLPVGSTNDVETITDSINNINNIITNGPSVASPLQPISLIRNSSTFTINAHNIIQSNRNFAVAETIAYLDQTYNPGSFNYNQELCYRDTGLIIDAVTQDILLGGNQKSIEAGNAYWNLGYNSVGDQITTTTLAISYARDLALQCAANTPITPVTGTVAIQVINPFFQYGGDYMPQQAISRNFDLINNVISKGVSAAPPTYAGSGLFSLTGLNGSDVKLSTKVTSITANTLTTGTYIIGLDQPTIGFGVNSTLYFGDTLIFPLQDFQVEAASLEYTGNANAWDLRKVDKVGSMGGSLVDGAVISDRSPIQSFVYDAFTQVNQGGRGVHITNNGYAQLVSVFTIFCSIAVQCDNGGIASIVNSNANFGDLCLVAKGHGPRSFSGTVFNPAYRSYPFSPDGADLQNNPLPYLDQFYPEGFWPSAKFGGAVEIFVPDLNNRPHIGLVMEIVSPDGHLNEQRLPGFLNAQPSTSTLSTGTINLTGIDTTNVYVGNSVIIRDQYGFTTSTNTDSQGNWIPYATSGTVVTDVGYQSIILNQALTSGGGDPINPTYFTLYFCGNSYYTVQTSSIAQDPYVPNVNILSANTNHYYQGPLTNQIAPHISAINRLNVIVDQIIANIPVQVSDGTTAIQYFNSNAIGGINSQAFIDLRFDYLTKIINAANITAALSVVPAINITTAGVIPQGAGSAITLITNNIKFMADEIYNYVVNQFPNLLDSSGFQSDKCQRDVALIIQQLIYDLESGGNYNMIYSGLSYWSRPGTYHIVELGEAVTRPDLFPDGATVNFYQRSYISASGYVFEYVGAGSNYGALPQRGIADPNQSKETVQLDGGKVFFTSTDQNGDFRIGPGLVISQATGVLSGRTFVQSLYANMTPFILAIE